MPRQMKCGEMAALWTGRYDFFLKTRDAKFIKYIYFKQGNIFQLPIVLETAVEKWLARLSVCLVVMYSTSKRVEIFAPTPTYIVLDPQIAT